MIVQAEATHRSQREWQPKQQRDADGLSAEPCSERYCYAYTDGTKQSQRDCHSHELMQQYLCIASLASRPICVKQTYECEKAIEHKQLKGISGPQDHVIVKNGAMI